MSGGKFLPFTIDIWPFALLLVSKGSLGESHLLYQFTHLWVGENLLQLLVGHLFWMLLQFQKPLY
jgi:hypothetical protein